jgi:hypothetical protein
MTPAVLCRGSLASGPSQLMVDKLFTVPVQAVGEVVGQLEIIP